MEVRTEGRLEISGKEKAIKQSLYVLVSLEGKETPSEIKKEVEKALELSLPNYYEEDLVKALKNFEGDWDFFSTATEKDEDGVKEVEVIWTILDKKGDVGKSLKNLKDFERLVSFGEKLKGVRRKLFDFFYEATKDEAKTMELLSKAKEYFLPLWNAGKLDLELYLAFEERVKKLLPESERETFVSITRKKVFEGC